MDSVTRRHPVFVGGFPNIDGKGSEKNAFQDILGGDLSHVFFVYLGFYIEIQHPQQLSGKPRTIPSRTASGSACLPPWPVAPWHVARPPGGGARLRWWLQKLDIFNQQSVIFKLKKWLRNKDQPGRMCLGLILELNNRPQPSR